MRTRDRISLGLGGGALVLAVLGVGGALREVQAIVALLVALALLFEVVSRSSADRLSPLVAIISAAMLLTAIQLIPLPRGVLHAVTAAGETLRTEGAALAHTDPWPSISLDPAGSLRALTFFTTLLGVALLSLRFAATERGRFVLLAGVAITCGLAAVVAGVHRLISADSLYGWYLPAHMKAVVGPLLNRNHMGGLMAIGAVLSVGLSFYSRQATQLRVVWVVNAMVCVVVCGSTLSRGAMIGMGIGVLVTGGILGVRHFSIDRRRHRSMRRDLPIAIVIGSGVALALYLSAGGVMDQISDTSLTELSTPISKYEAWRDSLELVREAPWVGVGRGAVEPTLTRVHPESGQYTFSHLENEYLTAVVDWGIPGALLLAMAFIWCVATAIRRWRDGPLAAAALGALAMILFQSFVDFGVEMLGVAIPVTIVASTVELVAFRPSSARFRVWFGRIALIVALLGASLLLFLPITTSLQEDHDDLLAEDHPTLADVRDSIERHPLDYLGFGELADLSSLNHDVHSVEFLNQALVLHPTHPGLHRLAARMLLGLKNYKQAAVEYAFALSNEPLPHQLLTEIATLIPDVNDATLAIPLDYPNVDVMLHSLKELKRIDIAERWLARLAALPQHNVQIIDTLYELATSNNDWSTAWTTAMLRLSLANTATSKLMLARVQFKLREFDPIVRELADVRTWGGRLDEKGAAWLILCDVSVERFEWEPALDCLHHLDASGLQGFTHSDIQKRIDNINDERAYESKMQAARALQKQLDEKQRKAH